MNLLKHLSHFDWGEDTKSLLKIYVAIIKPKHEYGVEAYDSASPSLLGKLDPIQNEALRIATGAFKCTRIDNLEVLTGVLPLELSRQEKIGEIRPQSLGQPNKPHERQAYWKRGPCRPTRLTPKIAQTESEKKHSKQGCGAC